MQVQIAFVADRPECAVLLAAGVLCVRLHAAGVHHSGDRHGVRDHCGHLLPAQRGELPLAVDLLQRSRLHICVSAQRLLRACVICVQALCPDCQSYLLLRPLSHRPYTGLNACVGLCLPGGCAPAANLPVCWSILKAHWGCPAV